MRVSYFPPSLPPFKSERVSFTPRQDMMVSSSNHHQPPALYTTVNLMLILFLTFSSKSEGFEFHRGSGAPKQVTRVVLGSTPPKCINRCLGCRPCVATLVTPPPRSKFVKGIENSYQGEEGYYLLGWKCRCGNKFFQP